MEMLEARNIEPTDRFLELAFGFSGVYVESRDSVDTDEYRSFQKDCVQLLQDWMDDRAEENAEAAAGAEPESAPAAVDETADPALAELLNTVRSAMSGGKAVNAKLLMLEAAARIARDQENEAAATVGEAERALSENARALANARAAVQEQENLVNETAAKVAEVQHGQEELRLQSTQLAERVEEALSRVESLDEQIRELQNRRDAAEAERAAAQEELDEARGHEQEHETSLESARTAEREARVRLEEERREAKTLQSNRGDLERVVIAQRELLARQRQSTQDIEQTIAHIRDSEPGESAGGNESLF
jgi:chromosome segregation ATPase